MTIEVIFEAHSSSLHNDNHLSSGWFDVDLSELGIQHSLDLGRRYQKHHIDVIFCSDLKRSYRTAEIAFGDKIPTIKDPRLRECNYGEYNCFPKEFVDQEKMKRIKIPFPNGESYSETLERMNSFLTFLLETHNNKRVLIIGHRATQYGLEYWINKRPVKQILSDTWVWQPGWIYILQKI
jgi:broad specificity phosphatase PhoE